MKRNVFRLCFSLLCFLSVGSVILCVGYNLWLDRYLAQISRPNLSEPIANPAEDSLPEMPETDENGLPILSDTKYVFQILLIGTDARAQGEYCRSDAMILLSVNRKTRKIVLCSLLRDLYVPIEGHGDNRLNTAYSFGGAEFLCSVLRTDFNIAVDRYVTVDFSDFAAAVDILGGVDLSVTSEEAAVMNRIIREMNSSMSASVKEIAVRDGNVHLDGMQTLAYVRNRSSRNGDFDRTFRQRTLLTAVFDRLKGASLPELLALSERILPCVTTNISVNELKGYVAEIPEFLHYSVVLTRIPSAGTFSFETVRGMAVILADAEKNVLHLYEEIYA